MGFILVLRLQFLCFKDKWGGILLSMNNFKFTSSFSLGRKRKTRRKRPMPLSDLAILKLLISKTYECFGI